MDTSVLTTSQRGMLYTYLRPHRKPVALLACALFGSIGLELLNPQLLRWFIDSATTGSPLDVLLRVAGLYIAVALAQQLFKVGATYMGEYVGWSATNALRADLFQHTMQLDLAFHKAHTPGELIERVDGDVTALAAFFAQFVLLVIGNVLLLVGVIVLLLLEDWRVGVAMALFAAVALMVLLRMRAFAVPAMTAERQAAAGLFGFIEERLAGLDDIRANGGGVHTLQSYGHAEHAKVRAGQSAMRRGATIWSLTSAMFALGTVLALAIGAWLYAQGSIGIGAVYLLYQYTAMLRRPIEQLADQLRQFQKAAAGIGRIQQLAAVRPTIAGGHTAAPTGALAVTFDQIDFAYVDQPRLSTDDAPTMPEAVLHDISLHVPPGRVLGLLGRTGSGKTTIARLLFRLYDVTAGTIRLGDTDIRSLPLDVLRQRVGMVTQDVQLFQATLRENLTLFDATIGDDAIHAVLETLGLRGWLASLPDGLDTQLTAGGGGFSAGESQLLAFARVFLMNPSVVILDEASSRLDPLTEARIERAIDTLLAGRTAIIIAHRLATVQRADDILILDGGRIAEYGVRDELAADDDSRFAALLRTGAGDILA